MNYNVIWLPAAENQLAAIWVLARDRDAVTRASERVDRLLALNPHEVGESRADGRRIVIELPLIVYFQIDESNRCVHVLHILASRSLLE